MKIIYYVFVAAIVFFMGNCTQSENESELITSLNYVLTDTSGQQVILVFKDLDGDGGVAPVINVSGPLKKNMTYSGVIELKNEAQTPAVDITQEIMKEAVDHQFFYDNTASIAVSYKDADSKGDPLGVKTQLLTAGAAQGKLTITLRHLPDKKAAGVAAGDIRNAGGESDLEVSFNIEVQ
ncbi:MAG: type 1 periplasmic binding fold superfamily protein [Saprospiraceae bacterium]|nr:type 1 periplasmic binding fold superfamily protein [Saprospiraceae bacterium]HMW38396.1 type 1 periplasmic binding fold superfamily protein [Saprospiraceae bacterium]HMX87292.1 type 1 periplasmic binding fold superfamily protein [Saprospiraceae bacterium]HMZ39119.1 type 1 periplasmic binding fold superfamily protein [Saprospiraceae bacterium]HNA63292.1 type 1 periplasmic binding fold superfamily protein [Saprospiraceae bacterium]